MREHQEVGYLKANKEKLYKEISDYLQGVKKDYPALEDPAKFFRVMQQFKAISESNLPKIIDKSFGFVLIPQWTELSNLPGLPSLLFSIHATEMVNIIFKKYNIRPSVQMIKEELIGVCLQQLISSDPTIEKNIKTILTYQNDPENLQKCLWDMLKNQSRENLMIIFLDMRINEQLLNKIQDTLQELSLKLATAYQGKVPETELSIIKKYTDIFLSVNGVVSIKSFIYSAFNNQSDDNWEEQAEAADKSPQDTFSSQKNAFFSTSSSSGKLSPVGEMWLKKLLQAHHSGKENELQKVVTSICKTGYVTARSILLDDRVQQAQISTISKMVEKIPHEEIKSKMTPDEQIQLGEEVYTAISNGMTGKL